MSGFLRAAANIYKPEPLTPSQIERVTTIERNVGFQACCDRLVPAVTEAIEKAYPYLDADLIADYQTEIMFGFIRDTVAWFAMNQQRAPTAPPYEGPVPNRENSPYFTGDYVGMKVFWQVLDAVEQRNQEPADPAAVKDILTMLGVPEDLRHAVQAEVERARF